MNIPAIDFKPLTFITDDGSRCACGFERADGLGYITGDDGADLADRLTPSWRFPDVARDAIRQIGDATVDDRLVLREPELHLHPRVQRVVGRLLAQKAGEGVNVRMVSYGNHALNGIRIIREEPTYEK